MRGRIRTIKPDIHLDEELWDIEQTTGLPLFRAYTGLWNYADREGRFVWNPRRLATVILPWWHGDFAEVLGALEHGRFIIRYEVEGKAYGLVRTFKKHQLINNKELKSELPAPPGTEADTEIEQEPVNRSGARKRAGRARRFDAPHETVEYDDVIASGSVIGVDARTSARAGFVYVAAAPEAPETFKIGFSERDPQERVHDLSCGSPFRLEVVDYVRAPLALETLLHRELAAYRTHRREWFRVTDASLTRLRAWFTRAPRVLDATSGEWIGKGMEGNEKEDPSRVRARDSDFSPSPDSESEPEPPDQGSGVFETAAAGGAAQDGTAERPARPPGEPSAPERPELRAKHLRRFEASLRGALPHQRADVARVAARFAELAKLPSCQIRAGDFRGDLLTEAIEQFGEAGCLEILEAACRDDTVNGRGEAAGGAEHWTIEYIFRPSTRERLAKAAREYRRRQERVRRAAGETRQQPAPPAPSSERLPAAEIEALAAQVGQRIA